MESFGEESEWDGIALSSLVTTRRNNLSLSPLLVSGLNYINSSHSGGSFFGIFPENGSTATPHTLPQPRVRDLSLARAEIAVLGLVLALTTLGNSFVLWVLLRRRKYNAPMHVFMVNLCVADLVVAFFQVSSIVRSSVRSGMNRRTLSRCHWCHSSTRFPQISKLLADFSVFWNCVCGSSSKRVQVSLKIHWAHVCGISTHYNGVTHWCFLTSRTILQAWGNDEMTYIRLCRISWFSQDRIR